MTIITKQDDLYADSVGMKDLVETWNALNPDKPVTRFSSVEVGRSRCANAILAAQNVSGHAGVPKGAKPEVNLEAVAAAAAPTPAPAPAADPAPQPQGDAPVAKPKKTPVKPPATAKAPRAAKKPAPAPKKAAKPAPAPKKAAKPAPAKSGGGKRAVYERVRLTEPDTPRRPQESSQRFKVLTALRKRKQCTVDQLSEDVGFNARAFVHKLAAVGWCEVIAANESGK